MNALYAGLLAWGIELSVAILMMAILKREENKVIARRKKNK